MKKFFYIAMIFALMILPNICSASVIQPRKMDGEYHIVYPSVDPDIDVAELPIYGKISMKIQETVNNFWNSLDINDFVKSTLNYQITCDKNNILSMVFTMTIHVDGGIYDKDAQSNDIPAIYKQTLNFDMRTGDFIEPENLQNIFGESNYTPKNISQKLKAYAKAHNLKLSPAFENLQSIPYCYYVDENLHLHFIFNGSVFSPSLKYYDFVDVDATI